MVPEVAPVIIKTLPVWLPGAMYFPVNVGAGGENCCQRAENDIGDGAFRAFCQIVSYCCRSFYKEAGNDFDAD